MSNFLINVSSQGFWGLYVMLFLIIFCETGLVVVPFLPGDSLLFLCGSMAAMGNAFFNIRILIVVLAIAAFLGDSLNFEIGKRFGGLLYKPKWSKHINPVYLEKADVFFKQHGSGAIFLGRFVPIIRTLIPFTAGISNMIYRKFLLFNILGGISWVSLGLSCGYFLGNISFVKNHFELLMVAIILISLFPVALIKFKKKSQLRSSDKLLKRSAHNEKE